MLPPKIYSLASTAFEFLAGIGSLMFITRYFDIDTTGMWFVFIGAFSLLSALRDSVVQPIMSKSMTAEVVEPGNLRIVIMTLLTIEIVAATIVFTIALWLPTYGPWLILLPVYSFSNAWYRLAHFYLRSQGRLFHAFQLTFTYTILLLFVCTGTWSFQLNLTAFIALSAVAFLIAAGVGLRTLPWRQIWYSRITEDGKSMVRLFGLWSMLREGISALSSRIGLFLTSGYLGFDQTAILGVCQRSAQLILLPNQALQSLLLPEIMRAGRSKDHQQVKRIYESSLANILAVTLPPGILLSLFSWIILEKVGGAGYGSSWSLLVMYVAFATLISPFGSAFGSLVTAIGRPVLALRVVAVNGILNILISWLLIPQTGISGVAVGLVVTEIAGFLWCATLVRRISGINIWNSFLMLPEIYKSYLYKLNNLLKSNYIKQ